MLKKASVPSRDDGVSIRSYPVREYNVQPINYKWTRFWNGTPGRGENQKDVWNHHLLFDDTTYKKLSSFRQESLWPTHTNQYQPTDTTTKHHLKNDLVFESPKLTTKKRRFLTISSPALLESASAARPGAWRNSARGDVSWVLFFRYHHPNHQKKMCFRDFFGIRNESKLLLRGIWKNAPTVEEAQKCSITPKKRAASYNLSLLHVGHPQWSFRCFVVFYANLAFIWHPPAKEFPPLPKPCWLRESLNSWTEVQFGVAYHVSTPSPVCLGTPLRSKITSTNLKWWASK